MENIVEEGTRKVKGWEDILVIGREEHAPIEKLKMEKRWHKTILIEEYEGMKIFMANKNLQKLDYRMKGAIVWLEGTAIIAMIIAAQGAKAYVEQLYPPPPMGKSRLQVTLAQYGFYLQQFGGQSIVHGKYKIRNKDIDAETGEVNPLLDKQGHIKMNMKGPDIVELEDQKIPEEIMNWLYLDKWATREIGEVDKNKTSYDQELDTVGVLYIYAKNPRVLKQVIKGANGKPLIGVPIGNAMKSHCGRYV
jgi:hypothetical protein